jgi:hypothetical protein
MSKIFDEAAADLIVRMQKSLQVTIVKLTYQLQSLYLPRFAGFFSGIFRGRFSAVKMKLFEFNS